MGKLGTKLNSKKQQAISAKLELIIDKMGTAMREANRCYVARPPECSHDKAINFTFALEMAWLDYVYYCREYPND